MPDTFSNSVPAPASNQRPEKPRSKSYQQRRRNTPLKKGEIERLKPEAKPRRFADGEGMYLQVEPTGGKHWRMAYRFAGKQKTLSFGSWPNVDIIAARKKRESAKDELRAGRDPGAAFTGATRGDTFGAIADEVIAKMEREECAEATLKKNRWLLQKLAAPLKDVPIAELEGDTPRIFELCEKVSLGGRRETAIRLRGAIGGVFKRAIITGRAKVNPTVSLARELPQPNVKHHPGITSEKELGRLLLAIETYPESRLVGLALRLAPYVFLRPIELRAAEWSEVSFKNEQWIVPAARTKSRRPHVVPLAPQVVAILREVQKITGSEGYVFPSLRSAKRPLSEGTLRSALATIGYSPDVQTPHGFRSTASTLIHKARKWPRHIVEFQLAHLPGNDTEKAYDHNEWIEEREEIMKWWADDLDRMRKWARQDQRFFG